MALLTSSGGVKSAAKRQLDCAGVVITVYAACEVLAARHGHADLCGVRVQVGLEGGPLCHALSPRWSAGSSAQRQPLPHHPLGAGMRTVRKEPPATLARQVSEDHCWLSLDGSGRRDAAVELTTSNAALRGLAPGAEAWSGWLYAGGRAHTLTQRQVIASLVVSVDPTVVNGRAKKVSGQLAGLQLLLLLQLQAAEAAMYPAAVCALAAVQQAWMNGGWHGELEVAPAAPQACGQAWRWPWHLVTAGGTTLDRELCELSRAECMPRPR